MVLGEAVEELRVKYDVAPARADEGGARKGGWLVREAQEDLLEEVLVIQRGIRHRQKRWTAHTWVYEQ